jgi:hypothetical protein
MWYRAVRTHTPHSAHWLLLVSEKTNVSSECRIKIHGTSLNIAWRARKVDQFPFENTEL